MNEELVALLQRERDGEALLSVREAARELGVAIETVQKYCRQGHLPARRLRGTGPWRIRRRDLQGFAGRHLQGNDGGTSNTD